MVSTSGLSAPGTGSENGGTAIAAGQNSLMVMSKPSPRETGAAHTPLPMMSASGPTNEKWLGACADTARAMNRTATARRTEIFIDSTPGVQGRPASAQILIGTASRRPRSARSADHPSSSAAPDHDDDHQEPQ